MSIHQYPRCAAYHKGMRVNLNDHEMTDYWFACILGDRISGEVLERENVKFERGYRDGQSLLQGLERILVNGLHRVNAQASEALKALIGSRGVKASKLKTIEDFWKVSAILWPQHFKGKICSLDQLEAHIRSLSKKQRQAARAVRYSQQRWSKQEMSDDITSEAQTIAVGQLRAFIERIERLEDEKKTIGEDISEVYAELKGSGFDSKVVRTIIRPRKKEDQERQEEESILQLYMDALGMS